MKFNTFSAHTEIDNWRKRRAVSEWGGTWQTDRERDWEISWQCHLAACILSYTGYNNADRTGRNGQPLPRYSCAMQHYTTTRRQNTHTHTHTPYKTRIWDSTLEEQINGVIKSAYHHRNRRQFLFYESPAILMTAVQQNHCLCSQQTHTIHKFIPQIHTQSFSLHWGIICSPWKKGFCQRQKESHQQSNKVIYLSPNTNVHFWKTKKKRHQFLLINWWILQSNCL